jgi:hypothetical protein
MLGSDRKEVHQSVSQANQTTKAIAMTEPASTAVPPADPAMEQASTEAVGREGRELPTEPGVWFDYAKQPWLWDCEGNHAEISDYGLVGTWFPKQRATRGGWSKAVPESELTRINHIAAESSVDTAKVRAIIDEAIAESNATTRETIERLERKLREARYDAQKERWRVDGLHVWMEKAIPECKTGTGDIEHNFFCQLDALKAKLAAAHAQIKELRLRLLSAAGDDLCRLSQEEIKELTSGAVQIPPKGEFLASCERFHEQIAAGPGVLSGCLTLAQLIAENEKLKQQLAGKDTIINAAVATPAGGKERNVLNGRA